MILVLHFVVPIDISCVLQSHIRFAVSDTLLKSLELRSYSCTLILCKYSFTGACPVMKAVLQLFSGLSSICVSCHVLVWVCLHSKFSVLLGSNYVTLDQTLGYS